MGKADNLPPSCAVVMKSGNLNFLEPSGPLRPVTGLLYLFAFYHVSMQYVFISHTTGTADLHQSPASQFRNFQVFFFYLLSEKSNFQHQARYVPNVALYQFLP